MVEVYDCADAFVIPEADFCKLVEIVHGPVWATEARVLGVGAWLEGVSASTVMALAKAAKERRLDSAVYLRTPGTSRNEKSFFTVSRYDEGVL